MYFSTVYNENVDAQEQDKPSDFKKVCTYTILPGVRPNSRIFMDSLHYKYYKHSCQKDTM